MRIATQAITAVGTLHNKVEIENEFFLNGLLGFVVIVLIVDVIIVNIITIITIIVIIFIYYDEQTKPFKYCEL